MKQAIGRAPRFCNTIKNARAPQLNQKKKKRSKLPRKTPATSDSASFDWGQHGHGPMAPAGTKAPDGAVVAVDVAGRAELLEGQTPRAVRIENLEERLHGAELQGGPLPGRLMCFLPNNWRQLHEKERKKKTLWMTPLSETSALASGHCPAPGLKLDNTRADSSSISFKEMYPDLQLISNFGRTRLLREGQLLSRARMAKSCLPFSTFNCCCCCFSQEILRIHKPASPPTDPLVLRAWQVVVEGSPGACDVTLAPTANKAKAKATTRQAQQHVRRGPE